ncbi:acyltransferase family protein [Guptibacillus algicola]|uniref:acyltransferase family protein n=1 Tax=Guptibacillus algicola TaxID=225844 RepID=UPI001CD3F623|nr:acyltransferase [Alkalihalobacillus algicola]MCA0987042.1 acyltransferase [Alkalihalobacillus algicola]
MTNTKQRFFELDAIRGLAALAVVFYHYTTRYNDFYPRNEMFGDFEFKYGYLGVNLFFIISGFVIYLTLDKCTKLSDFGIKRVIRLYPAYIIGVLLTFTIVAVFGLAGQEVGLNEAIINLSMLSGFLNVPYVDGAYWSLTIELTFYFIMALLFFWKLLNKIEVFSLLWLSVGFIHLTIPDALYQNLRSYIELMGILNFCHLFIAGIMFYLLRTNYHKKYYGVLILCLVYEFLLNGVLLGSIVLSFFILFYFIVLGKLHFLNHKGLVFLGTISYSLYLVHQNIGYVILNNMDSWNLTHPLYIVIPILISILLASLVTFYIEKPIQSYLLKRYTTMKGEKVYKSRRKAV